MQNVLKPSLSIASGHRAVYFLGGLLAADQRKINVLSNNLWSPGWPLNSRLIFWIKFYRSVTPKPQDQPRHHEVHPASNVIIGMVLISIGLLLKSLGSLLRPSCCFHFFKRLQLGRILDPSATSRGLNRNQYLPRLQCQIPTIQEPHVLVDGDSRGVMVWGKRWENLNKKKWRLPSTWFTCESFGWSWHCSIFT